MFGLPETVLIYTCCPDVVGNHAPFSFWPVWMAHYMATAPNTQLKEVGQGPGNREPIDSAGWEWSVLVRSLHAGARCLGSRPSSATY